MAPETTAEILGSVEVATKRIWAIASHERAIKGKKTIDTGEIYGLTYISCFCRGYLFSGTKGYRQLGHTRIEEISTLTFRGNAFGV